MMVMISKFVSRIFNIEVDFVVVVMPLVFVEKNAGNRSNISCTLAVTELSEP
jgi:hypothetical protein